MILVCENAPKPSNYRTYPGSFLQNSVSKEFASFYSFILIFSLYICTIHYFLMSNYLVSLTTLTTFILARTHSTVTVYAEESDVDDGDEEISNSVRNLPSQHYRKTSRKCLFNARSGNFGAWQYGFRWNPSIGNDDKNSWSIIIDAKSYKDAIAVANVQKY
jgi:hypothetical protein